VLGELHRLSDTLTTMELSTEERAGVNATLRGMADPWGSNGAAVADLAGASTAEVLDFITDGLGISLRPDDAPAT
jgi:hypothetical protein